MMGPPPGPGYSMPYGYPPAYLGAQTPETEIEMLEHYMKQLQGERESINQELEDIESRIEELKKVIEGGEPPSAAPQLGPLPYWGQTPYYPAPEPEYERQMLEQQAKAMESQIESIKKRLKELQGG